MIRRSTLSVARAYFVRDARIALSYPVPFVLELLGVLFTVGSTWFLAKLIRPTEVQGGYFAFATLGLAVGAFLYAGLTVTSRSLLDEMQRGTLEATLALGTRPQGLAVGLAVYPMIAAVMTAVAYMLFAVLFADGLPDANWGLASFAAILGALSFAGLGAAGASLVLVVQRSTAAIAWVVALLALLGGEFFPRSLLPHSFQVLGSLSPFTQTLDVTRSALLSGEAWSEAADSLALLAAMTAGAWMVGIAALAAGLQYGRRHGTLARY